MTFNKSTLAVAALAMAAAVSAEELCFSERMHAPGAPSYRTYQPEPSLVGADEGREPTIGIPHNTDSIFFQAVANTLRIRFDDDGEATWENVTPIIMPPTNLDPMLYADSYTGRVFSGGLLGPCSAMVFSDDDGETWLPAGNMCTGVHLDHQTIGSGPPSQQLVPFPAQRVYYYCSQLVLTVCTASYDGGLTWIPPQYTQGACSGLHGHVRVSELTGTAVIGFQSCSGSPGFAYTTDNGLTWLSRLIAGANSADAYGLDPSIDFSFPSNYMYIGVPDSDGAWVAMSKDEGLTYEKLGAGNGVEPTTYLNVGQFHEPAIIASEFADVRVGDDERAAYAFAGLLDKDNDGTNSEYVTLGLNGDCETRQDELLWYYYVARTYDTGNTWDVQRVSDNLIQLGMISAPPCRNLLDFNDMDLDSEGRLVIGLGDGCIGDCEESLTPGASGYRAAYSTLIRQDTGRGLFSAFDNFQEPTACNLTGVDENFGVRAADLDFSSVIAERAAIARTVTPYSESSCALNCGFDASAKAASGCGCSPAAFNKCADYDTICVPNDSVDYASVIEVSLELTYGEMTGLQHKQHHLVDYLAESFRVETSQVILNSFNADSNLVKAAVYVPADSKVNAANTAKYIFDSEAFLAGAPEFVSGHRFGSLEVRVVSLTEETASTANANANAPSTAAAESTSAGVSPVVYVVPAAVGSAAIGAAAAYLVARKANQSNKQDLATLDQLA